MSIYAATVTKLEALDNPDPWLVEIAYALARLMDDEPTSAVAKELRTVVDLLVTQETPDDFPDFLGTATMGNTTKPK